MVGEKGKINSGETHFWDEKGWVCEPGGGRRVDVCAPLHDERAVAYGCAGEDADGLVTVGSAACGERGVFQCHADVVWHLYVSLG
jgi:hypothetical protein